MTDFCEAYWYVDDSRHACVRPKDHDGSCTDENEGDANADLEAFADRHRVRDD